MQVIKTINVSKMTKSLCRHEQKYYGEQKNIIVCLETNAEGGECRRRCDVLRKTVPDPSGGDRVSSVAVG